MKKIGLAFCALFVLGAGGFSLEPKDAKFMIIDPDLLIEKGDKIIFEKDSNVMRSKYDKFVFDKKAFLKALGDYKKWDDVKTVQITTKLSSYKTLFPKEGAVPEGGFKITYYDAVILKVVKNDSVTIEDE